jgi:hypothetical protein
MHFLCGTARGTQAGAVIPGFVPWAAALAFRRAARRKCTRIAKFHNTIHIGSQTTRRNPGTRIFIPSMFSSKLACCLSSAPAMLCDLRPFISKWKTAR